jgi:hypothetical protein
MRLVVREFGDQPKFSAPDHFSHACALRLH